jgi:demethylmenaquinone methyltransferase/2-methoxy-6-polyprenyl-1,4-benzoquinol methylase/phosphoethanolamine N-methyltransferase
VVVVLAHLTGGAALVHIGLTAGSVNMGGALITGLVGILTIKLLLLAVLGGTKARALASKVDAGITTGKTIHWAGRYDASVALLTLGRGRALRDRTIELASIAPGEAVLEVGCGTGEIAMRAKARAGPTGTVVGIDPSPEMIAVARRKAARARLEIDYRQAVVEALPYEAGAFDVVVSSTMWHHLPEDLKPRAVAEMRRVLKPGGRLIVVDIQRPTSTLGRLAPVWLLHRWVEVNALRELSALLSAAGFTTIETRETGIGYLGCVRARVSR